MIKNLEELGLKHNILVLDFDNRTDISLFTAWMHQGHGDSPMYIASSPVHLLRIFNKIDSGDHDGTITVLVDADLFTATPWGALDHWQHMRHVNQDAVIFIIMRDVSSPDEGVYDHMALYTGLDHRADFMARVRQSAMNDVYEPLYQYGWRMTVTRHKHAGTGTEWHLFKDTPDGAVGLYRYTRPVTA